MSAVVEAGRSLNARVRGPATEDASPGQVGSWRLSRLICQGRLCRVYQAAADGPQRPASYALKVLLPEWEDDPAAVSCIRREAQAGREVSHAHLVPVLAARTASPPFHLVMPWLNGATLAAEMKANGALPPAIAFWIARQTAEALEALHAAGWVHGDIKPDNILVSPQRHATLLDLGFAHRRDEAPFADHDGVAGTIAYMAPEQFDCRRPADIRADLYSLGVTLYEMLTGRVPFAGDRAADVIRQHRSVRPDAIRSSLPHLPREAAALVGRLLAKEPLRRPQSPRELIHELVRLEIVLLAER